MASYVRRALTEETEKKKKKGTRCTLRRRRVRGPVDCRRWRRGTERRLVARSVSSVVSWPCAVRYTSRKTYTSAAPSARVLARPPFARARPPPGTRSGAVSPSTSKHGRSSGPRPLRCLREDRCLATDHAGARGTGGGTSAAAAAVVVSAAAAAARPLRPAGRAPFPAVRAQVLRAPVQQLGPVRAGRRLRDRRRVRVPFPGGRQRAGTARPHRPPQERLSGRTLEHHRLVDTLGWGNNIIYVKNILRSDETNGIFPPDLCAHRTRIRSGRPGRIGPERSRSVRNLSHDFVFQTF